MNSNFSLRYYFFTFLVLLFTGCSATDTITPSETAVKTDSKFPTWYSQNTFSEDSLTFVAYGSAIHTDSLKAIDLAVDKANKELIHSIGKKIEVWRMQSVEEGQSSLNHNDIIILIRNTEKSLSAKTNTLEKASRNVEGFFYGFSRIQMKKSVLNTTMSQFLQSKDISWDGF